MKLSGMRDRPKKSVTVPEIPGQLGPMYFLYHSSLPVEYDVREGHAGFVFYRKRPLTSNLYSYLSSSHSIEVYIE